MKFIISGRNIDVTDSLRMAVEDKLGKLEKYFTSETEVQVTLGVEKDRQKIEVTIPVKGNIIRSEQVSNDMYVSIDLVEEIIERQLRKYKNKIVDKQQEAGNFQQEYVEDDWMEDETIKINAKLSASINQTHPHINPENIVTMLKDKLGILSGDVTKEQYDIVRTRIYFEDGVTDFR